MSKLLKATGVAVSLLMVTGSIGVQAKSASSAAKMPSFICAGGAFGCVLPLKAKPAVKAPAVQTPAAPATDGGGFPFLAAILAAAAVIAGIVIISDDNAPTSP